MLVIALCLLGMIVSAGVLWDSIGTHRKLRTSIYTAIHVCIFLACAWKMTGVAQYISSQKAEIHENSRTRRILERSIVRLAQAEGADASGSPNENILAALGVVGDRQLKEMAAADADPAGRKSDRLRVLRRLADVYAGEIGDLPRIDEGASLLPPLPWMNQKLAEYGFAWRVKSVSAQRAQTVDVGADDDADADGTGNGQSVNLEP